MIGQENRCWSLIGWKSCIHTLSTRLESAQGLLQLWVRVRERAPSLQIYLILNWCFKCGGFKKCFKFRTKRYEQGDGACFWFCDIFFSKKTSYIYANGPTVASHLQKNVHLLIHCLSGVFLSLGVLHPYLPCLFLQLKKSMFRNSVFNNHKSNTSNSYDQHGHILMRYIYLARGMKCRRAITGI